MTSHDVPSYRRGTHRACAPEQTLARLTPYLSAFGVTRCADITQLDVDLGMPVHVAIRPRGSVLQSSAGKGLTHEAAKVSALMEALELDVAERLPGNRRRSSQRLLRAEGERVDALPEWVAQSRRFLGDDYLVDWVPAVDLVSQQRVWLPASAAYFCEPAPCRTHTNGLASGNHLLEATLHALYEVVERDAVARLSAHGRITLGDDCRVIVPHLDHVPDLGQVLERIALARTKLVLLELRSGLAVPTYWALLLDRESLAHTTASSAGFGTHWDATIALARAIGEAIQSRLTMIHGSRDDIVDKPVYQNPVADAAAAGPSLAFRFFDELEPDTHFEPKPYVEDFTRALERLLALLQGAGHRRLYRVDLPCPVPGVAVVKVVVPTLRFDSALF